MSKHAKLMSILKAMDDCEAKDKLLKAVEEDGDDEGDEDDDGPDGSMEKSLDPAGLEKALSDLERLQGVQGAETLADRIAADADAQPLAKSEDASRFLKSLIANVAAHADDLGVGVQELAAQAAVNNEAVLATGRLAVGLVKSMNAMSERLDRLFAMAGQPEAPRAITARPVQKSFGAPPENAAPAGLGKVELQRALNAELVKSKNAGDLARVAALADAVALVAAGAKNDLARQVEQDVLRKAR